jgi:hypothetical protein
LPVSTMRRAKLTSSAPASTELIMIVGDAA